VRYNFSTVNRRACGVQFSTESVVITVLAMVSFSMRVRGRAHLLKIRLSQRWLVRRQCVVCGTAAGKQNEGDENRQQD
jgi:hypothetical protein